MRRKSFEFRRLGDFPSCVQLYLNILCVCACAFGFVSFARWHFHSNIRNWWESVWQKYDKLLLLKLFSCELFVTLKWQTEIWWNQWFGQYERIGSSHLRSDWRALRIRVYDRKLDDDVASNVSNWNNYNKKRRRHNNEPIATMTFSYFENIIFSFIRLFHTILAPVKR